MKAKKTTSTATASILLATLALLGSYDSVLSVTHTDDDTLAKQEVDQKTEQLASEIHKLIRELKDLDRVYGRISKDILSDTPYDYRAETPERIDALGRNLASFRGLEIAMRSTTGVIPDLHLSLRRALANTRSRIAMVHSLLLQATTVPQTFPSSIDMQGLQHLADHSTLKIVDLANA